MRATKLASAVVGLVAANFLWQAMFGQQWAIAADRTWFQLWAVGVTWWACR